MWRGAPPLGRRLSMAAEEKAANNDRREGWSQQAESISPGDRRAIETLLSALTPLSDLRDRPIPLPFAVVFLSIVLNEGQPVGRYAKDLNIFATPRSSTFDLLAIEDAITQQGLG